MRLSLVDYAVVAAFFAINLAIGAYYARRGGTSLSEFFLSGRNVPWWLAGTSMVATTFAADTPLAVTELVTKNGIAGNWLWWNMVMSGILTVFFFAALWRRSGVLTDVEFIELRYSGRPAAALRGVRAVYQGVLVNTIVMGWVNLAIAKILGLTLGIPKWEAIGICLLFTGIYVTIGGLWSVLVTDLLQFIVKMSMTIVLAVAAVAAVGGIGLLKTKLAVADAAHHVANGSILAFFPTTNAAWMPLTSFLVFIGVSWWASAYPGAEPGGGGYVAQRIFASKDEKNAILATLFFNVAHYALRPWPWILVALCAIVLYPQGVKDAAGHVDPALGYVQVMIDVLPPWARGLMMAGFLAAYMSTIGTQLNLGASYLTNDLYRRFVNGAASESHYVWVSRIATLVAMALAAIVTVFMDSVSGAWAYLLTIGAGVGLVMILRWYWWRINAWSEIAALCTSALVGSALLRFDAFAGSNQTALTLLVTVVATTVVWITVTLLTAPESEETLVRFYERVRPGAMGWAPIARLVPSVPRESALGIEGRDWVAGVGLVYGMLFGIGKVVLGELMTGFIYLALAAVCALVIARDLERRTPTAPRLARPVTAALLVLALLAAAAPARAEADKLLANVKGEVAYEKAGAGAKPLAPAASVPLANTDVASTGDASIGTLTLPDSSRITLASQTRVQMALFAQTDIAHAQFVVMNGKTRFKVEHPQGGKADYTFKTATGTISVRGTEGDIAVDGDELRVNVYSVGDANSPVTVTLANGKIFTLVAGQSLLAQVVNGVLQGQVDKLTQAALDQFSEMGVPATFDPKSLANDALNKVAPALPSLPGGIRRPF